MKKKIKKMMYLIFIEDGKNESMMEYDSKVERDEELEEFLTSEEIRALKKDGYVWSGQGKVTIKDEEYVCLK